MSFTTAVRSKVNKVTVTKGMKEGVRVGVAGAIVFAFLALFGTPQQQQDTVANPSTLTQEDVAYVLLAKETDTGSFLTSGSGGTQIIAGVYNDGTIFTKSGGLVIGTGGCYITSTGAIRGCVIE